MSRGAITGNPAPAGPHPSAAPTRLDDDVTATVDAGMSRPRELLPEGSKVGRYRIGRTVGVGGMGVVYEAFDPQLDRRVAIKFVMFDSGSAEEEGHARERMLREAQALAVLSHPNVVTVYDVGTTDSAVFIAMEHVEGLTLADWIQRDRPKLNDIVRTYCAAGEGLAAAHRAGLVHRDFKPQNVLLGSDGRVRVIDFGVARATYNAVSSDNTNAERLGAGDLPEVTTANRGALSSPITAQGMILGTPRYMSPEQREGKLADARSDQYCFCASLYEAVYGSAPPTAKLLQASSLDAERNGKTPPRWLRKLLLRGLAIEPKDRFANMDALLAELRRDRRAWLARATSVAAVLVALAAVSVAFLREGPEARCKRSSVQARSMWSSASQSRFRAVLSGAGAYSPQSLYASVDKGLGRFFGAYEASYVQACEATFVKAAQSSALFDLRMRCLERRRLQVEAVIQQAGDGATNQTLQHVPEALAHLADVSHCNDTEALQDVARRPVNAKVAAQIGRFERELDRVEGLTLAGTYQDADRLVHATYEKVQAVDYPWLRAMTMVRMGDVDSKLARYDDALEHYRSAARAATEGKDFALAGRAFMKIIDTHVNKSELDEGLALRLPTEVLLGSEADNPILYASYNGTLGSLYVRKSEFKEAEARFRKALELRANAGAPEDLDAARLLTHFGPTLVRLGKAEEAKRVLTRAVQIAESILGPDNPNMAPFLNNLAFAYAREGNAEKTADLDGRVLRMRRATLGEKHPEVGLATQNLGCSMLELGRWDEAEDLMRSGLAILKEALSSDHVQLAEARVLYASVPYEKGNYDEALRRYADAIEQMRAHGHAESESMVEALDATAVASVATSQFALARASLDEELRLSAKIYGESDRSTARALATRSRLALLQGQASDARKDASRVLELLESKQPTDTQASTPAEKLSAATAHFVLAQLARAGDPEGARAHASTAEKLLAGATKYEAKFLLAEAERFRRL